MCSSEDESIDITFTEALSVYPYVMWMWDDFPILKVMQHSEVFIFRILEGERKDSSRSVFLIKWGGGQFTPLCGGSALQNSLFSEWKLCDGL